VEKEHHDRTIHALPFRDEEKPVPLRSKNWRAPALIAALAVLLVGGYLLIHFLSASSPVQEAPAPSTTSHRDREGPRVFLPSTQEGEEVPHAVAMEQKAEENAPDKMGDRADSTAKEGYSRQDILSHLDSGRKHEQEGRDALAFAAYQEALRLDPASEEAGSAVERVRRKIADDQFRRHLSAGFTAYHKGEHALAKTEFRKAEAIRPGAPEVQEALALADGAVKLKDLEVLKGKAAAAEEAEEWEKALDLYLAALRIDGKLQFALEGRERALERMTLKKRLDFYLQKPEVLESEDYLQKAAQLIVQAEHVEPGGPRHREAVQKLQALVREAQTEIPVTLISDTFTEVSVFKVGKLGTFDERELFLRPGTYTVVGVRDGYRDVRQEIVVKTGDSGHRITILCREKI